MMEQTVSIERMEDAIDIFGSFDENIRLIEQELGVRVVGRDDQLKISGEDTPVAYAAKVIQGLIGLSARGESIHEQNVRYLIQLVKSGNEDKIQTLAADVLCVTAKGKPVKAKTVGQKKYVDAIRANTVTLGVGPAGTGKTYLAVAAAYNAGQGRISTQLQKQMVSQAADLWLVEETSRYMFRLLAAKAVISNPQRYGFLLKRLRWTAAHTQNGLSAAG